MEQHRRGNRARGPAGRSRPRGKAKTKARNLDFAPLSGPTEPRYGAQAASPSRPGLRRRAGGRLGGSDRRRPWGRQVDRSLAGGRPSRRGGATVHHISGEEGDRSDPPARRPARPRRGAGRDRRGNLGARYRRGARYPEGAVRRGRPGGRDRFDPDHVPRQSRIGAWHRVAGARQRPGTDPPGQTPRLCPAPGRARDQGGSDRRAQGARAHGRCGAVVRRRPRPPVPHPARGQEPLRPDRRDRRLRDDRCRHDGGRQPLAAVPGRPGRADLRRGGLRRSRGDRAPSWSRSRRSSPRRPWPRRAARWSVGTVRDLPWSSRFSRPAAAWCSPDGTST